MPESKDFSTAFRSLKEDARGRSRKMSVKGRARVKGSWTVGSRESLFAEHQSFKRYLPRLRRSNRFPGVAYWQMVLV